ncbi:MAG TPA: HlyD family efflux transporter periplasmic adaptor subunit [Tepidisphaeraceae bacterium]|nr:HlyD family efflux transporter periplasmic adaptor subunit [Tepidisphaeraceae bacterium]
MTQMTANRIAPSRAQSGRVKLISGVVALALVGGAAFVAYKQPWRGTKTVAVASSFFTVEPMDLEIVVKKDGELQAQRSTDILNQVEGTSTIVWIVREGAAVEKGQPLAILDSSQITQRIEDTALELQKAQNDVVNSRELREIQISNNAANLEAAEVALKLAELDLKQYVEGTYPQQSADAKTTLEMAKITLKNREEDLAQRRSLFSKGFVTAAEVKRYELEVTNAANALAKAETSLRVLSDYSHAMNLASKRNALAQAEQRLARTRRENKASMSQRDADVRAKEQSLSIIQRRMDRLREQEAACRIAAPEDGMVVYGTTGDRNAQNPIQEGAQVRERQTLLRLPDVSAMKAVVRLNESQVPRIREKMPATVRIVGMSESVDGIVDKISVLADSGSRWMNPDLKEYPVDVHLLKTPAGLKPGMGAQVEILVDSIKDALAVPMAALYTAGRDSFVFVRKGDKLEPVKVTTGRSTETHIQIVSGLQTGMQVKLLEAGEGRALLEAAGITPEPLPRGRPGGGGRPNGATPNGAAPVNGAPAESGSGTETPRPDGPRNGSQDGPSTQAPGRGERDPAPADPNRGPATTALPAGS